MIWPFINMYNLSVPTLSTHNLFSNPTDFLQADVSFSNYEIKHSIWKYLGSVIPGLITFCVFSGIYLAKFQEEIIKFKMANEFKRI
jgi:hypothetical protein